VKRREFIRDGARVAATVVVAGTLGCATGQVSTEKQQEEKSMAEQTRAEEMDAAFGEHMDAELSGDLDRTMATMTANPHLVNVPTMLGGQGPDGVRTFYANRLIGQFFPPDVKFETLSRTYGQDRLVVIVGFEGDKVSYEHIYWDQGNLLVQLGLIDPEGLPLTGGGAAAKLRNPSIPDPFFNES
jgi:carboxymethylenebutenolidase